MIMDFDGRGEGMRRAFEKTEEERLEIKKKKPMERDMYFVCMLSRVWLFAPMDCSLPGSSVCGILQAGVLE